MSKDLFNWFVRSSKNPQKYALTIKGLIPFLVLFNIGDANTLSVGVDSVINFLVLTGTWVSGAITVYGALRKIYLSLPFVRR